MQRGPLACNRCETIIRGDPYRCHFCDSESVFVCSFDRNFYQIWNSDALFSSGAPRNVAARTISMRCTASGRKRRCNNHKHLCLQFLGTRHQTSERCTGITMSLLPHSLPQDILILNVALQRICGRHTRTFVANLVCQ